MAYIGSPAAPTVATVSDGTVTSAKLADDAVTDTKIATLSGDLNFGDNAKANFGASNDLEIYHNGAHSLIDNNTGNLYILTDGTTYFANSANSENYATFNQDGAVTLYYDNSAKLSTTSTGATVSAGSNLEVYGSNSAGTLAGITMRSTPRFCTDTQTFENTHILCGATYGNIIFSQGNSSTTSSNTERMRIDTSGNLKFNSGYGSAATAYGCRVWINFNGTGTVAIVNSGNVSSVTDNGTGHYTVNFSNSFPDNAYAVCTGDEGGFDVQRYHSYAARNSGSYVLKTGYQTSSGSLAQADIGTIMLAIFR